MVGESGHAANECPIVVDPGLPVFRLVAGVVRNLVELMGQLLHLPIASLGERALGTMCAGPVDESKQQDRCGRRRQQEISHAFPHLSFPPTRDEQSSRQPRKG